VENEFYRIGEAAKLTGTTKFQLRFYDRSGLISPLNRDESSKYRLYSRDQLIDIMAILDLQELGFSLAQVKSILCNRDTYYEQITTLSKIRISQIDEEIEKLKRIRDRMEVCHRFCSDIQVELELRRYFIESVQRHDVVLTGRRIPLSNENIEEDIFLVSKEYSTLIPDIDWWMTVLAFKINVSEYKDSRLSGEFCFILDGCKQSRIAVQEPTRLCAMVTRAVSVDEIPHHVDMLLTLANQASLRPVQHFYVQELAKDKTGQSKHLRRIRLPLEMV
jgi:DNA-binding transcriptional MerR regulator